jgi:hypothetical protein
VHHGVFALPPLRQYEEYDANNECHKCSNDSTAVPCFGYAAPLHSKDKAHDRADNQSQTSDVQLPKDSAPPRPVLWQFIDEKEEDEEGGETAHGKIDVETVNLSASFSYFVENRRTTTSN